MNTGRDKYTDSECDLRSPQLPAIYQQSAHEVSSLASSGIRQAIPTPCSEQNEEEERFRGCCHCCSYLRLLFVLSIGSFLATGSKRAEYLVRTDPST